MRTTCELFQFNPSFTEAAKPLRTLDQTSKPLSFSSAASATIAVKQLQASDLLRTFSELLVPRNFAIAVKLLRVLRWKREVFILPGSVRNRENRQVVANSEPNR